MWMLVCFFLPAILFCICALIVWLRVLHVNRRREKRDKRDRKLEDAKQLEKKSEVVCSIPIRVLDVETGKTFIYSSNEEIRPECQ